MRDEGLLSNRNFLLFLVGLTLSEIGVRGTLAINLYHVFSLTGSTVLVGVVGLFQFLAVVLLGPLGGAVADRFDRRRLLQVTQSVSLIASSSLAALTLAAAIEPWHIYVAVLVNSAAATFDGPARRALVPALVERQHLVPAFALITPAREVALMLGPATGGLLVAAGGPGWMYVADAGTYVVLIATLGLLRVQPIHADGPSESFKSSIRQGFAFVRAQRIIRHLLAMDLAAMLFSAYRAVLPALAEDVLDVGPEGYGLLAASVPAGALIGSWCIYRVFDRLHTGRIVIAGVAAYGAACLVLARSPSLVIASIAAITVGAADAVGSSVRQAAVQLETPDRLRGRVSAVQQMATRGGPALGDANMGVLAGLLGPVNALSVGATIPIVVAAAVAKWSRTLPTYRLVRQPPPDDLAGGPDR